MRSKLLLVLPSGNKYDYVCQPHLATNMRGSITVQ